MMLVKKIRVVNKVISIPSLTSSEVLELDFLTLQF